MLRARAAAAADDLRAGIEGDAGIIRHEFGRAGVVDVAVDILRDAAIALGHDSRIRARLGDAQNGGDEFGGAHAAIGADGDGLHGKGRRDGAEGLRRDAHHGAAVGIEAHGGDDGQACCGTALDGGLELLLRRHGLDPDHVRAAFLQRHGLFGEGLDSIVMGECADGFHDLARGADGATDIDGAARCIGLRAGVLRGGDVELSHLALRIVELQAMAVAAEGIGEDDVRACLDEAAVQRAHPFRMIEIPHFRGVARFETHLEVIRARGPIGQQPGAGCEGFGEGWAGHESLRGNDIKKSLYPYPAACQERNVRRPSHRRRALPRAGLPRRTASVPPPPRRVRVPRPAGRQAAGEGPRA